ncbi:MAG: hypothetical protein ISS36_02985 [Candidatus Aenigmarchaeota archaeon]|nr:hypothetical protein [Candidatus Aenigmarchaeota archaeon]
MTNEYHSSIGDDEIAQKVVNVVHELVVQGYRDMPKNRIELGHRLVEDLGADAEGVDAAVVELELGICYDMEFPEKFESLKTVSDYVDYVKAST